MTTPADGPATGTPRRDFDLLDIPLEGVAAYWLSLHKLLEPHKKLKNAQRQVQDEAQYTTEPLVRYLLEALVSDMDVPDMRRLGQARADMLLDTVARRLQLMRVALLDMATAENPRRTLAKMTAQHAAPLIDEEKAFSLAQQLLGLAASPGWEAKAHYFAVDHRLKDDKLMVALLFHAAWTRREGKMAARQFLPHLSSVFFQQGLALVIDGFDAPFLRKRLKVHQAAIMADARRKAACSLELACAIKHRLPYEVVFTMAKAWLS
ncbi:MAG: hypothetical protein LDL30_05320 [Desulfovibrio sp.]|nr:hypothetical protein [Desulfovibrio sp.]